MKKNSEKTQIGMTLRALLALAALFVAMSASAGQYDSWGYHASIQFNGYGKSETLTNFPALVVLGTNITGFAYNQFLSGTNDLRFTDSTGNADLNYEIDTWNTNGLSYVWVQVPTLTGSTAIQAWWGAAGQTPPACTTNGATWTSGYVGVWHMNQTNVLDSTTNINTGKADQGGVTLNGGEIGTACSFNGSTGRISVPSSTSLNFTTNALTIESWVCVPTTLPTSEAAIVRKDSQWSLEFYNANTIRNLVTTSSTSGWTAGNDATYAFKTNTWYYSCFTYNGANVAHLINAQKVPFNSQTGVCTGNIGVNANPVYFAFCPGGTYVAGLIDEIRISRVARSTNWLWACYQNIVSNGVFQSYGNASAGSGLATAANADPTNVVTGAAWFNGSIAATGSSPVTAVSVYWGPTDSGTNAVLWANTNTFAGSVWNVGDALTTNITTLVAGQDYFYTYGVGNAAGNNLAQPSKYLTQGALTLTATDASCGTTPTDTATVTVTRPSGCTGGVLTVWYNTAGAATNGVNYSAAPASGSLTIPAGATSATITITPQAPYNLGASKIFTVSLTNGFYLIGSANTATCTLQTLTSTAYTWSGSGANNNCSNPTNWGQSINYPGIAGAAADTANFGDSAVKTNVNFDAAQTIGTIAVTGTKNWSWSGSAYTENIGLNYGSTGTGSFSSVIAGPGGVTVTAGVLTNNNAANTYTGTTQVKGGALEVSVAAFNSGANSAAGNSTADVLLGDPTTGTNAELRISLGGTRNITVQNGLGARTIRTVGSVGSSSAAYTGTYTLNADTTFAPGYASDAYNASTLYNINGTLTGTGGVIVAGASNTIVIGGSANTYSGATTVKAGVLYVNGNVASNNSYLGSPAAGNEPVLLGDTNGANNATLKVTSSAFYRPITVQAGSSGMALLDISGNNDTFWNPITLNKDLYIKTSSGNNSVVTNAPNGAGALNLFQAGAAYGTGLTYFNATPPGHRGGTVVSSNLALVWTYPNTLTSDTVLQFGTDASGVNPGTITLNGGYFAFSVPGASSKAWYTINNPLVVNGPGDAKIYGGGPNNGTTNAFSGPISLGTRLSMASGNYAAANALRETAIVTLVQTNPARCGLLADDSATGASGISVFGNIVDGPGTRGNSLALREALGGGNLYAGFALSGNGSTYAYGTIVEDSSGVINIKSSTGPLGTGPIWVLEGGMLRLNAATQVAPGASADVFASGPSLGMLAVSGNFLPSLTPDSAGVLAIDTTGYNAVTDLSQLGNGRMYLGTISGGTFSGAALNPCNDNVYRLLGSVNGSLTVIATNVLTGATAAVQAGAPNGFIGKEYGGPNVGGWGRVYVSAPQNYGGGSVVDYNSTLEGVAQTNGSPFGSAAGGVTLNGGFLQLDGGAAPVTNAIGTVTVHGYGAVLASQAGTALTEINAALGPRSNTASWVLVLNGSGTTGGRTMGGSQERIVLPSGAPAVSNNMVAPWMITTRLVGSGKPYAGPPDFLTYNTNVDAYGTIGFTNAIASYSNVADAVTFQNLPSTAIANVTNTFAMTGPASVYALRVDSTSIGYSGTTPQTITIGSGGLLFYAYAGTSGGTCIISNNLVFGAEGVISLWCMSDDNVYSENAKLMGTLTGTNGLTINAQRNGYVNPTANNAGLTGTIAVVRGWLQYNIDAALGAASNPIYLDGGGLNWYGTVNNARPIYLGPSGGWINNGNGAGLDLNSGAMSGPGALVLQTYDNGNKLWITGTNNSYGGGTIMFTSWGGSQYVATNSTLGNGDVMVTGGTALYLYGDRNIGGGDWYGSRTTNRQARLCLNGNYYSGTPGSAYFMSMTPSIGSLSGAGTVYMTNTVLTLGGDNSTFVFDGLIQPAYAGTTGSLHKVGTGTFYFKGLSTLTGTNVVDGGTFVADGTMSGGITVNSGATLAGAGSVGPVTLNSGATFLPGSTVTNNAATNSMSTLSTSSLAFNGGTVTININGPTNYTQIVVNGSVSLGGATLVANLNYKPSPTDVFYIVLNNSGSATTPGFAGLAEGAVIHFVNGYQGHISYVATGDATAGNDVKIYNLTKGGAGTAIFFQ